MIETFCGGCKMNSRKSAAAAAMLLGIISAGSVFAERVETLLDGNDWTLDGLPVLVPNCWNKIDAANGAPERAGNPAGATSYDRRRGVYARPLPDAKKGRRYFIRCDGASQTATVRVNGVEIGLHKGAFTAFCFEATAAMRPTGNSLEVEVSNEIDKTIPPISADFSLHGGLYRHVWLLETDPVCIDPTIDGGPGVRVFPEMDGTVRVEADISGADDVAVDWEPKKVEDPVLWSPETPRVYKVRVTVRKGEWSDTVVQPFGFRTTEIREDGFYLNGVKRKVRGVNRHQELEGMGWELTEAQEERDFRLIKAMGADGVRLAHYPQSENVYNLCDRLGFMVWSEIPVVDEMGGAEFIENAKRMFREMVAQNRNHPSVCWWSVWNEIWSVKGAGGAAAIARYAESLDTTRPIVAASATPAKLALNTTVKHICFNMYPGWYTAKGMEELVDKIVEHNMLTTLAISEYGAGGSVFQHQNPPTRPNPIVSPFHPEEWQTKVHMDDYRHILGDDRLWGSFVWAMFDFAADTRKEGDRKGINDKGLVTRDRVTPKDAYFLYKANWNPEPMLHLCSARMKTIDGGEARVVAFSNVGDVTLIVNGETIGVKSPDEIHSVTFDGVKLRDGENEISVEAGGLKRSASWTKSAAPAAEPDALGGPQPAPSGASGANDRACAGLAPHSCDLWYNMRPLNEEREAKEYET